MSNESEMIKVEFRFSSDQEKEIIKEELNLSAAENIIYYDGLIEADVPPASLENLKVKNILMDFPNKVQLPHDNTPALFSLPVPEMSQEESDWLSLFKNKASSVRIDEKTNKFIWQKPEGDFSSGSVLETVPDRFTRVKMGSPAPEEGTGLPASIGEKLYTLTLNGPMNHALRENLVNHAITLSTLPTTDQQYQYLAILSSTQYNFLHGMKEIVALEEYSLEKKLTPELIRELSVLPANNIVDRGSLFEVALIDNRYINQVESLIATSGIGEVVGTGQNIIRLKTAPLSPLLAALAKLPYVTSLSSYNHASLFLDVCRETIGVSGAFGEYSFTGEGEIVGIIDSGIDQDHPDLKNQIIAALSYNTGSPEDLVGHGTHVAGIICGDGTASGGEIKGIAPKAKVVSIGVLGPGEKMDLPVDLGEILLLAAQKGAKIINLSWGYKLNGEYQHGSFSVDKFVYDHPEILVVVAAGNEGNARNGFVSYKTLGVPASAKNVLTVGAASSRRKKPAISETWGSRKPANFPAPPQKDEKLISQLDIPSLISSRGPTDYDSIKPEVIAPGSYMLSTKATRITLSKANPEYYENEFYTFKTGTSMAAPVISGLAALLREYLRIVHQFLSPSSSLLKALIISCSQPVSNTRHLQGDPSLQEVGFPDFDQGFGMVRMQDLLSTQSLKIAYSDVLNTDPKALVSRAPLGGTVKSYREYVVDLLSDSEADLVITLCWIDPPAKGVQNNLQLSVKTPNQDWKIGNMEHVYKRSIFFDTANAYNLKPHDKYNNVEKIVIQLAQAGKYLVKITAQNTINTAQGYSLAILGKNFNLTER